VEGYRSGIATYYIIFLLKTNTSRIGDGTVPYASLNFPTAWKDKTKVTIEEIDGATHREILASITFFQKLLEYVAWKPRASGNLLPPSFSRANLFVARGSKFNSTPTTSPTSVPTYIPKDSQMQQQLQLQHSGLLVLEEFPLIATQKEDKEKEKEGTEETEYMTVALNNHTLLGAGLYGEGRERYK